MAIREALKETLSSPATEGLWRLRAELLEAGIPRESRVWGVIGEYQRFLEEVRTGVTSRHYSDLASKLDIGSISGVILDRFLEPQDARQLTFSLLSGVLSEGLMVMATRQHVKAWEEGLGSVCTGAAWFLYEELWHWTHEKKPELPAAERRRLLDLLFKPICSAGNDAFSRAVVIGTLFQLLLLSGVSDEVARLRAE
jgi:hypothetical protein